MRYSFCSVDDPCRGCRGLNIAYQFLRLLTWAAILAFAHAAVFGVNG